MTIIKWLCVFGGAFLAYGLVNRYISSSSLMVGNTAISFAFMAGLVVFFLAARIKAK